MFRFIEHASDIFDLRGFLTPATAYMSVIGFSVAPVVNYIYGDERMNILIALCIIIALDWLTGIVAARKDGIYSSEYGINGMLRTLFILLFPALANQLDQAFDMPGVLFYGTVFALYYHVWNSMTANAVRAGWDKIIPNPIQKFVESEIQAKDFRAKCKKEKNNIK